VITNLPAVIMQRVTNPAVIMQRVTNPAPRGDHATRHRVMPVMDCMITKEEG
jgi:hypothetical protein